MSIDQTKLAAAQFRSDHTELGSRRSQDDLAVYKAMLKELPPALQDPQSTVVRDLLWEMEEDTMNSEPLISFDKLVIKMAIMLRSVHGAAKKSKEANSTALTLSRTQARQRAKEKARAQQKEPRPPKARAEKAPREKARVARAQPGCHARYAARQTYSRARAHARLACAADVLRLRSECEDGRVARHDFHDDVRSDLAEA
jgi:hypothetical protein